MRGIRRAVPALMLTVLVACSTGPQLPGRVDPPDSGRLEIGVAYGVNFTCPLGVKQIGNSRWVFAQPLQHWPPPMPPPDPGPLGFLFGYTVQMTSPHPVPGILVLSSQTRATFRADADGSLLKMRAYGGDPGPPGACL